MSLLESSGSSEIISNTKIVPFRNVQYIPEAVNPELPWQYENSIIDVDHKNSEIPDKYGNQLSRWRILFDDGTKLGVNWYHSAERITDTPIIQTPAWLTGLHGHNEISEHKFAARGFDTLLVGHVGEERDSWLKEIGQFILRPGNTVHELGHIQLAKQAHQMLAVQKVMSEFTGLSSQRAHLFGESRGAMTGLATLTLARSHGITIDKALLVSPCFETSFNRQMLFELRAQLPGELLGLVGDIGHVSLGRLRRSHNTINLSPKSIIYEAAHTHSLLKGAGMFVEHIPQDQNLLILGFKNDVAGQTERWQQRFAAFPNAIVQPAPKGHVSGIMDERTIQLAEDYFLNKLRMMLV
ncbi:MAG: hypothetical protein NVS1B7_4020 [Candidatus Saccharimonadales bacterium]